MAFLAVAFLAVAFLAVAFLAVAFFAVAFFAVSFFAVAFFAGTVSPRFAISRLVSLITSFKDTSGKRQSIDASFWRGRRPRHRPSYVEPYSTDKLGSRLTLIVTASAISMSLWFERRASSRSISNASCSSIECRSIKMPLARSVIARRAIRRSARQARRAYALRLMERQELLSREASSWESLMASVARVPEGRRTEPGVVPGWSVADLVWHCGYWVDDAARRIELIAAGTSEPDDPESVWQKTNDEIAEESKAMSWDEIVSRSEAARERIRAALLGLSEIPSDAESEFVDETFDHYDEHAAEIERFAGS